MCADVNRRPRLVWCQDAAQHAGALEEGANVGTKRKASPKRLEAARKKATTGKKAPEEPLNLAALERAARRAMARSTAAINAGDTYRAGARGGRQAAPSKTDGQNYS